MAYRRVLEIRVQADRQVGGQGPGRGRPDDKISSGRVESRYLILPARLDGKLHVDGRRLVIVVLDFRFRQGGAALGAPVNRLEPLVHHVLFNEPGELADNGGLVGIIHGEVRLVPVGKYPQPFELFFLNFDKFGGVFPAQLADLAFAEILFLLFQFLAHLMLDRQTVAIPSRNKGSVESLHALDLDDKILEHFVQCMAHMDVAVGIRRSVMENILGFTRRRLANPGVEVLSFPLFENLRLLMDEVRPHRKIRHRQVQCFLIIHIFK